MIGAKIDESPKYVLFSTNTIEKIAANIGVEFNHPQLSLIIANDLTFQLRKQVEIAKRRAKKQRLKRLTSFVDPHTNTPSRSSTIDHVALLNKNLKHQIYLPKITIQPDLLILNKYSISSRLNRPVKIQRSRQLLGKQILSGIVQELPIQDFSSASKMSSSQLSNLTLPLIQELSHDKIVPLLAQTIQSNNLPIEDLALPIVEVLLSKSAQHTSQNIKITKIMQKPEQTNNPKLFYPIISQIIELIEHPALHSTIQTHIIQNHCKFNPGKINISILSLITDVHDLIAVVKTILKKRDNDNYLLKNRSFQNMRFKNHDDKSDSSLLNPAAEIISDELNYFLRNSNAIIDERTKETVERLSYNLAYSFDCHHLTNFWSDSNMSSPKSSAKSNSTFKKPRRYHFKTHFQPRSSEIQTVQKSIFPKYRPLVARKIIIKKPRNFIKTQNKKRKKSSDTDSWFESHPEIMKWPETTEFLSNQIPSFQQIKGENILIVGFMNQKSVSSSFTSNYCDIVKNFSF